MLKLKDRRFCFCFLLMIYQVCFGQIFIVHLILNEYLRSRIENNVFTHFSPSRVLPHYTGRTSGLEATS